MCRGSWAAGVVLLGLFLNSANADLFTFFDPDQSKTDWAHGVTSDTIRCDGYQFAYTMDKLWSASPGGTPTGRFTVIDWPDGVQAQAVTVLPPPPASQSHSAIITITRVDGDIFDLTSLTAKLCANTGGAGATLEIMPLLNGEDAFVDPSMFNVTGSYGQSFHFDELTPQYLGNTSLLKGYDTYKLSLYVDFGLTTLTLEGAPTPEPAFIAPLALIALAGMRRRSPKA